jgi:hypothetical protein
MVNAGAVVRSTIRHAKATFLKADGLRELVVKVAIVSRTRPHASVFIVDDPVTAKPRLTPNVLASLGTKMILPDVTALLFYKHLAPGDWNWISRIGRPEERNDSHHKQRCRWDEKTV